MISWCPPQGSSSSAERGVCPNWSRYDFEGFFLRFRTWPPSMTMSLSYCRPSTSMDPNRSSRACIFPPPVADCFSEYRSSISAECAVTAHRRATPLHAELEGQLGYLAVSVEAIGLQSVVRQHIHGFANDERPVDGAVGFGSPKAAKLLEAIRVGSQQHQTAERSLPAVVTL